MNLNYLEFDNELPTELIKYYIDELNVDRLYIESDIRNRIVDENYPVTTVSNIINEFDYLTSKLNQYSQLGRLKQKYIEELKIRESKTKDEY